MRMVPLLAVGLAAVAFVSGCETTQEKSAKLEVEGKEAVVEGKIELKQTNRDLEVTDDYLLTDQYGSAVVLRVRNRSDQGQVSVPVQIDVKDRKGKSVFRNDQEGLEDGLLNLQIIGPKETTWWVNDQVLATRKPAKFEYELGPPAGSYPAKVPEIVASKPTLRNDPTSGPFVSGTVVNKSAIEQESLLLYAVGTKGGKVVAAGRGGIPKLKTDGKRVPYSIFFIGDPRGANIEVFAIPTTLN